MNRNLAVLLVGLVASGCGSPALIQVETTIRPDGSCDRLIWQPKDELLPDGALSPEWRAKWRTVADISTVPPAFAEDNPKPDRAYFHAEGSFANPAAIPPHYLKRIADHPELGASELIRSYQRDDYGLIVAHRWSETITNIVTRDDYRKAADQFIDVGVPMFRQALDEVFGREYDMTALGEEVRKRARPFLDQLLDIFYDMQAHPQTNPDNDLDGIQPRFVAALRGVGVKLPEDAEKAADSTVIDQAVRDFLRELILRDVKRRDDKPVTEADAVSILSSLTSAPFKEEWDKYAKAHKEELDAKLAPLVVRMTGLYNYPPIFSGPAPMFAFGLRLPGWVVATNGTADDKGHVAWRFGGGDLFPAGFEMTAESVEINRPAQTKLLGRVVIDDAKTARALRDLVAKDEGLADLLRLAVEAGDPAILRDAQMENEAPRERLDQLKELLQLQQ